MRRPWFILSLSVLVWLVCTPAHATENLSMVRRALRSGQYEQAAKVATMVAQKSKERALAVAPLHAEALVRRGLRKEAIDLLQGVADDPAAHRVRLLLAEVLLSRGKRSQAEGWLMKIIDAYNDDRITDRDPQGLGIVGRAAFLLRSYRDANEAFNLAEQASRRPHVETLLWRAELFLDKYDPGHAAEVVALARKIAPKDPRVVVLHAQVKLDSALDFASAERDVTLALAQDPHLAEAHFVRAGLALRSMDLTAAAAAAQKGLKTDPENLQLLSVWAATRFLAEDQKGFAALEARVLKINPSFSSFYGIVSKFAEWEHRYDDIVALMKRAVKINSADAKAYASLGINLIRRGEEPAGLEQLRKAWRRDRYNVRVYNTLELYDGPIARDYVTVEGARFRIRYHRGDRAILERYLPKMLDEAWSSFVKRYGFTPKTPVGIEVYADRQHFSVRTSGLPNIGIQGVCFGQTLAALGPSVGRLNWGMIVWHELAHVFHIQQSNSRVPRWFTEGLAEYESMVARSEWQREEHPALYRAYRDERVPTIGAFNRAFTHARRSSDVTMAYFAASQLVAFLAERHGTQVFAPMLRTWSKGLGTERAIADHLKMDTADVDRAFLEWLKPRFEHYDKQFVPRAEAASSLEEAQKAYDARPDDALRAASLALTYRAAGRIDEARATVEAGLAQHPKHADLLFVGLDLAMGRRDAPGAKGFIARLLEHGHDGYAVRMRAADLAEAKSKWSPMREHLKRAAAFDTTQSEPWQALYDLARDQKDGLSQLEALRALAKLEQHDRRVWRRLLVALVERGLWSEAVRVGQSAVYADVASPLTHYLYGRALARTGRWKRAIFEMNSAIIAGAPPALARKVYQNMGHGYRRLGRADHAERVKAYADALRRVSR